MKKMATGVRVDCGKTAFRILITLLLGTGLARGEWAAAQQAAQAAPSAMSSSSAKSPAPSAGKSGEATTAVSKPAQTPAESGSVPAKKPPAKKPEKKVDLNNATLEELKTLPMVGDADAKKIIANRPYKSKGELVTKAGLPEGVLQAVTHKVELQTPRKAAAKK